MFEDWLATDLREYQGHTVTVETDIDRLPSIEGRLVTVMSAYLSLAVGDRLIVIRAEHVVALRLPNASEEPEETTQP